MTPKSASKKENEKMEQQEIEWCKHPHLDLKELPPIGNELSGPTYYLCSVCKTALSNKFSVHSLVRPDQLSIEERIRKNETNP